MNRRPTPIRPAFAAAVSLAGLALHAGASVPMLLLDSELHATSVLVESVEAAGVRIAGAEGGPARLVPWSETAALWSPEPDNATVLASDEVRFVLVDGQVLITIGPLRAVPEAEAVDIRAEFAGPVRIPLEKIDRVHLPTPLVYDQPQAGSDDLLVLAGGDVRRGFVVSIGETIELETDGVVRPYEADTLVLLDLANPAEPATGAMLVLAWDSTIAASLRNPREDGVLAFAPALSVTASHGDTEAALLDEPRTVPLHMVRAIVPDAGAGRPIPLSSLPAETDAAAALAFAPAVRTGTPDLGSAWTAPITLDQPGELRVALPDNAAMFRADATLAEDPSGWAGCVLVVEALDAAGRRTAVARAELSADADPVEIRGELPAGARGLAVRVEPGPRGPVRDQVTLTRAVVLVRD